MTDNHNITSMLIKYAMLSNVKICLKQYLFIHSTVTKQLLLRLLDVIQF